MKSAGNGKKCRFRHRFRLFPDASVAPTRKRFYYSSQKDGYLKGATLFVTLEPCLRCRGAILKAGISHLYYRSKDEERGALSYYHIFVDNVLSLSHIQEARFSSLLSSFFQSKRKTGAEYDKINRSDEQK